jgi:hypothetical protein
MRIAYTIATLSRSVLLLAFLLQNRKWIKAGIVLYALNFTRAASVENSPVCMAFPGMVKSRSTGVVFSLI